MAKKTEKKKPAKKVTTKAVAIVETTLALLAAKLKPAEIRFIHLYLGGEGGACWNNGTKAYAVAFDKDLEIKEQYNTSRTEASKLLTKPNIQEYKRYLLAKHGFTEDSIKERFGALSFQDSNLGVALAATEKVAKIAGVIKDESVKVNIPELAALGESIKGILEGKASAKK